MRVNQQMLRCLLQIKISCNNDRDISRIVITFQLTTSCALEQVTSRKLHIWYPYRLVPFSEEEATFDAASLFSPEVSVAEIQACLQKLQSFAMQTKDMDITQGRCKLSSKIEHFYSDEM